MLSGLYGHAVCTMHCWSICPVPFTSHLITTHTSPPPLLISQLIALVVLGIRLRCRYSAIVWSCEHSTGLDSTQFNSNGCTTCHMDCKQRRYLMRQRLSCRSRAGKRMTGGGWAVSPTHCAFMRDQMMWQLDDYAALWYSEGQFSGNSA